MTAAADHLTVWAAVGGAALFVVLLCGMLLFAIVYSRVMDHVTAWMRSRRAALALPGPETTASAQERRAAEDLGYGLDHQWWRFGA